MGQIPRWNRYVIAGKGSYISFWILLANQIKALTDNIEIGGFTPHNLVSGEHVLFLASFHSNDVTLSQFQVMITLLLSFIESMTVVLPYSPVGMFQDRGKGLPVLDSIHL